MARFKLKDSVIATLTSKGYIDGSGNMKIRVPCRTQGEPTKMFELEFHSSEIVEPDSRAAEVAVRHTRAPAVKVNGVDWLVMDPAVLWFDELDPAAPGVIKSPRTHGTDVLHRREFALITKHARETGGVKPTTRDRVTNSTALADAIAYFSN